MGESENMFAKICHMKFMVVGGGGGQARNNSQNICGAPEIAAMRRIFICVKPFYVSSALAVKCTITKVFHSMHDERESEKNND
jgi:hypothetical protein